MTYLCGNKLFQLSARKGRFWLDSKSSKFSGTPITRFKTVQLVQLLTETLESFNTCTMNVLPLSEIKCGVI